MAASSDRLYVTYVEGYNGLLKIWGQPNRTCATYIEKQLLQLVSEFNRSPPLSPSAIHKGMICMAKHEDETYYRARVISDVVNNTALVFFIDYGNKGRVDLCNLKILGSYTESIVSTIVPQAEDYYLANIKSEGGWPQEVMNEIRRGLCYSEYKFRTVCQAGNDKLIQISYRNEDYSSFLISQELAKPVSVKEQMILIKSAFKNETMEPMGNTFRSSSFNQQIPQSTGRDRFFIQNKVPLRTTAQDRLIRHAAANAQQLLSQSMFTQPQSRNGLEIINGDRQFNAANPPSQAGFSQSGNVPALSEPKSAPVINTVVIEALANQLKQHLLKDQLTSAPETAAHGYITQVLDVKTTHNVYISCIDDGPWSFSIQLVSNEHELNQLMDDLAAYSFQPIKLPLILGSSCIARSQKYDSYCRGVLVNITHSAVKVFYVDFGNTEDLPYNRLFEIPAKFFKVKTMSQKFALSGLQRVRPTEEIKKAFAEVVENELLILHVTNLEGENLPTCDLYLKDVNIKRILNEKLRIVKGWETIQFPRPGEIENVLVTCVETPHRFYVQLKRCESELREIKAELARCGKNAEIFDPEDISPGAICICNYARDKNWYRAVVTSVNSKKAVTVFYVDYGYTEIIDIKTLRKVCSDVITKMKGQAIPCCLHGYEGGFRQLTDKSALTELILGREFSLKVVSEGRERINVQLFDNGKDVLLGFKSITSQLKQKSPICGQSVSAKTGSEKMDSGIGRGGRDLKPEKVKVDALSWRLEDRKEFGPKPRDKSKHAKAWDIRDPASDTKNEKYDDSKFGRYNSFKGRRSENIKLNDRDERSIEKNWRGTDNVSGDDWNKIKVGPNINDRMKKIAQENEERGLMIEETTVSRLPVKLGDMTFDGKMLKIKEIKIGSTEEVLVTYFVNPEEIYVRLASCKEIFSQFMLDISDYYNSKLPMLKKPKKGDVVISKFKEDGILYRAVVVESDPITVRYIDFGNEEVSERENLWVMDKKFLDLEVQCVKCVLPKLKPVGSDIWPAPNYEMDKIFEYESYSCTFLKKSKKGYVVKLVNLDNGRDVRDELISAGFAHPAEDSEEDLVEESVEVWGEESVEDSVKVSVQDPVQGLVQDLVQISVQDPVQDSFQVSVQDPVQGPIQDSFQIPVHDSVQVSVQDQVQGPIQDPVQISVQDSVQSQVQESFQVSVQDPVQGQIQDSFQISVQDPAQDSSQISEQDPVLDSSQISEQDPVQESFQISVQDPVQESFQISVQDPVQESFQISVQDPVQESFQISVQDPIQDSSQISEQDPVQESFQISVQDSVESPIQDSVQISVQDSVESPIQDSSQVSVQDPIQGPIQDSVQISVQDPIQGPIQDSVQISVQDSVQDSVEEKIINPFHYCSFRNPMEDSAITIQSETKEIPLPPIQLKKGFKTPFDLLRNEVFNVFVSHIVDVSEFYVQIKCRKLKDLEKDIVKYVRGEQFRSCAGRVIASNGNLCLANVEGSNWCRAKVMETTETNVTVSLIDYGNTLCVNREQIGLISKELAQYPIQAVRCCLLIREDKLSPELNEEFLSCVKKNFSAFFHEDSDEGLKVTLYDTCGEKLKFLDSCNSAPIWIRPICDLPIINRQMQVAVSHINSPKEIYVQLLNDVGDLARLISLMMIFYSDKEEPEMSGHLSEFEIYAVRSLVDGTWYRGELLSQNEKSVTMFYIDFGNSEEVPRQNLRRLDSSFFESYAYAKKVSLNISYPRNAEKRLTTRLQKLMGKKVCPAYFVKVGDNLHAEFIVDDSFISSELVSGGVRLLHDDIFEKFINRTSEDETKVFISHVNHPGEFWVHEEIICTELSDFQDKLQAACSNAKPKNDFLIGDIVGVLFKDGLWYRASVMAVKGNIISIRFLDYGNTFDLDKTENKFIALTKELKEPSSFVRKCSLQGSWKKNAASRFEDIVLSNEDPFDLIEIDDIGEIVDLLHNGSSVTEQLINEGYKIPENVDTVFITHINSPTDFYIQKEKDQGLFDMMSEKMVGAGMLQDPYSAIVNELYCARYPEDGLWYRGKVLCKDRGEVVVIFIDYGNCSIVTEIKELAEDLKTLRPLSMNCCLVNINPKDSWSEAAKNHLWKFVNNVPLKMEIVQQTSEVNVVRLITESGEDLSETLLALEGGSDQVPKPGLGGNGFRNGVNAQGNAVANIFECGILPKLNTMGTAPVLVGKSGKSSKKKKKSGSAKKLSCPERASQPNNAKGEETLTSSGPNTSKSNKRSAGSKKPQNINGKMGH